MRVVVFGADGFIGQALMLVLRDAGYEPVGCGSAFNVVDRTALPSMRPGSAHAVVHLAGGGGPEESRRDPVEAVRTHVLGTSNVADFADVLGAKAIFTSSCYVYPTSYEPLTEECSTAPDTLYGALKEAAELVWVPGVILRLAHVYGPSPRWQPSVTGKFARAAAEGDVIQVHGSGRRHLELVHVEDVCRAIVWAIERDDLPHVVNIGSGETAAVKDLAALCREFGATGVEHVGGADVEIPPRRLDCTVARRHGWEAKRELIPSMREWIEALR